MTVPILTSMHSSHAHATPVWLPERLATTADSSPPHAGGACRRRHRVPSPLRVATSIRPTSDMNSITGAARRLAARPSNSPEPSRAGLRLPLGSLSSTTPSTGRLGLRGRPQVMSALSLLCRFPISHLPFLLAMCDWTACLHPFQTTRLNPPSPSLSLDHGRPPSRFRGRQPRPLPRKVHLLRRKRPRSVARDLQGFHRCRTNSRWRRAQDPRL